MRRLILGPLAAALLLPAKLHFQFDDQDPSTNGNPGEEYHYHLVWKLA